MFADSLLETSWAERGRRSCTTLTSFGLQAVIIGLLLLLPLLTTVGLPSEHSVSTPVSLGPMDPGPTPSIRGGPRGITQSSLTVVRSYSPDGFVMGIRSLETTTRSRVRSDLPALVSEITSARDRAFPYQRVERGRSCPLPGLRPSHGSFERRRCCKAA